MTKNNQNGRSMIEMLGVLAIIGVLSVGGIAGYTKAMMKYKVSKTINQISMLSTNIQTLFAARGNYTGLDTTNPSPLSLFKNARIAPDDMWNSNSTELVNAFGGTVIVYGDGDKFTIYMQIPRNNAESCIELATADWTGLSLIKAVGLGNGDTLNWSDINYKAPPSPLDISTACANCVTGGGDRCALALSFSEKSGYTGADYGWSNYLASYL